MVAVFRVTFSLWQGNRPADAGLWAAVPRDAS